MSMDNLQRLLLKIDNKGYKAYKEIRGKYDGDWFQLFIDYVQGDPFANPSRLRVAIPQAIAKLKNDWFATKWRQIALEDFLVRMIMRTIKSKPEQKTGLGNSGLIAIDSPGQEILPRTAVKITEKLAEVRLSIGLPAAGRVILGRQAIDMLCHKIPTIMQQVFEELPTAMLERQLQLVDQQEAIRDFLLKHNYAAFVANGAILPRESGISNRPLQSSKVIQFQSPKSLEIEIPVPHREPIKGMAIPQGITLIVGGGFHGKSTLLKGIERGVYNHIWGDGREYVITDNTAWKVRAEDGRRVEKVNISPFINNLPYNQDTMRFSTDDASGSTSQAANIIEAMEIGCKLLLMDEDTSATNFMIRDARMQALVAKNKEPITPFIDKVQQLVTEYGISTILVIGGSGDYLDVADTVIMMDEYTPKDVTVEAKNIGRQIATFRRTEGQDFFGQLSRRVIQPKSFEAARGGKEKVDARGVDKIFFGTSVIDLALVEQLVDPSQARAIANMIKYLADNLVDDKKNLSQLLELLYQEIDKKGLEIVSPYFGEHPGDLALPRKHELAAAINRLRTFAVK